MINRGNEIDGGSVEDCSGEETNRVRGVGGVGK